MCSFESIPLNQLPSTATDWDPVSQNGMGSWVALHLSTALPAKNNQSATSGATSTAAHPVRPMGITCHSSSEAAAVLRAAQGGSSFQFQAVFYKISKSSLRDAMTQHTSQRMKLCLLLGWLHPLSGMHKSAPGFSTKKVLNIFHHWGPRSLSATSRHQTFKAGSSLPHTSAK